MVDVSRIARNIFVTTLCSKCEKHKKDKNRVKKCLFFKLSDNYVQKWPHEPSIYAGSQRVP